MDPGAERAVDRAVGEASRGDLSALDKLATPELRQLARDRYQEWLAERPAGGHMQSVDPNLRGAP